MLRNLYRSLLLLCCIALSLSACSQRQDAQKPHRGSRSMGGDKGDTLTGPAVKIIDGDTFDLLLSDNTTVRIRMHGIDCPERGQAFYKVCRNALGDLCGAGPLKVVMRDKDRYGRTVADVYNARSQWVNYELVAGGFAWHYTKYDNDDRLARAEVSARAACKGLWADAAPVAPWDWRRERRNASATKKAAQPRY